MLIDSIAKPVFDGKQQIADLSAAMAEARAAAMSDPTGLLLHKVIEAIKAQQAARVTAAVA